jgi:hypothetical protein
MIASSHPKHDAPVEEASLNQHNYAEKPIMRNGPGQEQHPALTHELGIILDSA